MSKKTIEREWKLFEERPYSKKEISAILGIDPNDKKFAQKVKTRMANLGFNEGEDYIYKHGGEIVILKVPTERNDRIQYLVRLLDIDKQVDPLAFATFLYRMAFDGDFQCMPWAERVQYLKDNDDIEISEEVLRKKWIKKLYELNICFAFDSDYEWWCTVNVDGQRIRSIVETDEEKQEMQEYWEFYFKTKEECKDIKDKKERGQTIFNIVWGKYHCKYYKCKRILFCAWQQNEVIEELIRLVEDYIEEYWSGQLEGTKIIEEQKQDNSGFDF